MSARSTASVRPANASSMCRKLVTTYPYRYASRFLSAPKRRFFDVADCGNDSRLSSFLRARTGTPVVIGKLFRSFAYYKEHSM